MGNAEKKTPLTIVGPKGIKRVCESLRVVAPEIPFSIEYIELNGSEMDIELHGFQIHAFKVKHNVPCYGYSLSIPRAGKFDVERAKAYNIPLKCWNPLQKGNIVEFEGKTYTPDMVMGPDRQGIKVTYCTDSRPIDAIWKAAEDSDLFVIEGMYGEEEKAVKAKQFKHMTFYEAAELAKKANVKEAWLTHFSPSMTGHKRYMNDVQKICPVVSLGYDGRMKELDFLDE